MIDGNCIQGSDNQNPNYNFTYACHFIKYSMYNSVMIWIMVLFSIFHIAIAADAPAGVSSAGQLMAVCPAGTW